MLKYTSWLLSDAVNLRVALICVTAGILLSACSSTPATAPSAPQITGAWLGEQRITAMTGGECIGAALQDQVGLPSQFHAAFTQDGSHVTATLDIDHTGDVCTFTGTLVGTTLDLTAADCSDSKLLGFRCPNGGLRDVRPKSASLHATLTGATIAGTALETDTVFAAGTSDPIDSWVIGSSFTLARQ
jgi:hypothetical protein